MNDIGTSSIVGAPVDFVLGTPAHANTNLHATRSSDAAERRVLLISYAFPPTGGGGVQRAVKFSKYLPSCGWRPTILTAANPSVPVQDHDLAEELDPSTKIVRARTWEPGYGVKTHLTETGRRGQWARRLLRHMAMQLLQPDPQVLWNVPAYHEAVSTLRQESHDAILVTGPPFSSFLLARKLKKRFGIPLILDFRDEWMLVGKYLENHQLGGLAHWRQCRMMRRTLKAADAVITTTKASAAELACYCRKAKSAATVSCIYNGFDHDDLSLLCEPPVASTKLRIVYTGTLWKLTDISPLVFALESLAKKSTVLASSVELIVAGRSTPPQDTVLARLMGTGVSVVRHDYLPHGQSLQLAATADQLLLLLADEPGAERVVPAKVFEYMALGKPILAISPDGETCDLMREHAKVNRFHPREIEKIADWLESQLAGSLHPGSVQQVTSRQLAGTDSLDQFSRQSLTRQLADVLQCCVQQ
jgi:glycosyltransferase involved in cell wall biosynthesis